MIEEIADTISDAEMDDNPYNFIRNTIVYGYKGLNEASLKEIKSLYNFLFKEYE